MSENSFDDISYDDWITAAETALRGKSVDSLNTFTADGISVNALYTKRKKHHQVALPSSGWQINQTINHPNITDAKAQIAEDLEQGVNGLSLHSNQAISANGYGLNITAENIENLFQNTYLNMISLRLESGLDEISMAKTILNHSQKHNQLSLGIDPIGKFVQFGGWQNQAAAKKSVISALQDFKATHILRVDGRIAHNAGASEAQELAFILSTALTYLKWADEANIDLNITAQKIEICLSADQNQFLCIAKMRAMRQLWAELLDSLDIDQSPAYIYAETSYRMSSNLDPYVNLLRSTIACFSAGIGGANQIGVLPLSAAIGLAPSFDRRLARHVQTILIEESHLTAVTDPSAGSFYVETLTAELTQTAWNKFQYIQKSGGIVEQLINGEFQQQVAALQAKRKPIMIGTNVYTTPDETIYQTLNTSKTKPDIPDFKISIIPLTATRDAEIFEQDVEVQNV